MKRRRTEIMVETHETWRVRMTSNRAYRRCAECVDYSEMLPPEDAARLARVSPRMVYRRVEAGRIHFTESAEGGLFVCLVSLFNGGD